MVTLHVKALYAAIFKALLVHFNTSISLYEHNFPEGYNLDPGQTISMRLVILDERLGNSYHHLRNIQRFLEWNHAVLHGNRSLRHL